MIRIKTGEEYLVVIIDLSSTAAAVYFLVLTKNIYYINENLFI